MEEKEKKYFNILLEESSKYSEITKEKYNGMAP